MTFATFPSLAGAIALVLVTGAHTQLDSFGAGESVEDIVQVELLAEVRSLQPGTPFWVSLHLEMKDEWHVNWINPGDAGLAPTITWTLPEGYRAGDIQWPYPSRIEITEMCIFGYNREVHLLVMITPPERISGPLVLSATVDWLACAEACVPGQTSASITLEAGRPGEPDWSEARGAFDRARRALPAQEHGWKFEARINGNRVSIGAHSGDTEAALERVTFFPYESGVIENASKQVLSRNGNSYRLDIERARMSQDTPARIRGVVVSDNGWGGGGKAIAIDIPIR